MKTKRLTITEKDFLLANRRASRQEELDAHGRQVIFRTHIQKSGKMYDRKKNRRVAIDDDCNSFVFLDKMTRGKKIIAIFEMGFAEKHSKMLKLNENNIFNNKQDW